MPDEQDSVDDGRVARREELLAEEKAAGSQDAEAQAQAILAESDERTASRAAAPGARREERTSEDATPPPD